VVIPRRGHEECSRSGGTGGGTLLRLAPNGQPARCANPLSALVRPNYAPHLTGPERSEPGERGRGDLEQIEDELLSGVELRIEALNEQAVLS